MVNIFKRLFKYNWKYYFLSIIAFLVFWQVFSVFVTVKTARDKLQTAMLQNAAFFEEAFLSGNVFETQKIMWRISNENIKRIKFYPVEFEKGKWVFKEAVIGNLYERPNFQLVYKTDFISNGAKLGHLEYVIDLIDINSAVFKQNYILFISVFLFFTFLVLFSNMGALKTILGIEKCVHKTNEMINSGKTEGIQDAINKNLKSLPKSLKNTPFADLIKKLAEVFQKAGQLEQEIAISKAMSDLSAQVAHDIRSPLVALETVIKDISGLPEEKQTIIKSAAQRIKEIANDLLDKYRKPHEIKEKGIKEKTLPSQMPRGHELVEYPNKLEVEEIHLAASLIEPIISEKQVQFKDIEIIFKDDTYNSFVSVNAREFKRVVSNLINNAAESLIGDMVEGAGDETSKEASLDDKIKRDMPLEDFAKKGKVEVFLIGKDNKISIEIKDNGKGIPKEILHKLGKKGETHGKKGGSGLGLYHAKTTMEKFGGSLEIKSEIGKGTSIMLTLQKASPPKWFISEIIPRKRVIIIDDDENIHKIWEQRFKGKEVGLKHFYKSLEFKEYLKENNSNEALYLLDYEFKGEEETGLSAIKGLNIKGQVVLVTGAYDRKEVQEECLNLNIGLLPKPMINKIPISTPQVDKISVLIDNDDLVIMNWKISARKASINLITYKTKEEFYNDIDKINKETPIYIDSDLSNNIKGENIAKDLKDKGYSNITLTTGYNPEDFSHMPWLKVIGKEPPFSTT